jgi:hypothetical protein
LGSILEQLPPKAGEVFSMPECHAAFHNVREMADDLHKQLAQGLFCNLVLLFLACRMTAVELTEMFISRSNRETFQRALSRGNSLMVTVVEVDFAFPPHSTVIQTCNAVLSAGALWRSVSR